MIIPKENGIRRIKGINMFPFTLFIQSSMNIGNEFILPMRRQSHSEELTLISEAEERDRWQSTAVSTKIVGIPLKNADS